LLRSTSSELLLCSPLSETTLDTIKQRALLLEHSPKCTELCVWTNAPGEVIASMKLLLPTRAAPRVQDIRTAATALLGEYGITQSCVECQLQDDPVIVPTQTPLVRSNNDHHAD